MSCKSAPIHYAFEYKNVRRQSSKDWVGKNVTIPNFKFLIVKSSEMILFIY